MKAIILAAGKGRRISEISQNRPKCYMEIAGKRILDHQLDALAGAGVRDIVMVTGYQAAHIEADYAGRGIQFIRNPFFEVTNVLSSLWFARDQLQDGFYFMHADTYFDASILTDLVHAAADLVLCVEMKQTVEEEMKVVVVNGVIRRISKQLDLREANGEFTGVAKIGRNSAPRILEAVQRRIEELNDVGSFFEAAVQDAIDQGSVTAQVLDIGGRFSVEIDFPEDYERALQLAEKIQKSRSLA